MTKSEFFSYVDHTLLKPNATREEYIKCIEYARDNKTASACIFPHYVELAKQILDGSGVKVCTVIGFPFGTSTTESKVAEAIDSFKKGADEIDMVMNISAFLSEEYDFVLEDIKSVVNSVNVPIKVILETAYLNSQQISLACKISEKAGAKFVKTSTGYASSGAKVDDVKVMVESVGSGVQVKASGGISTLNDVMNLLNVGCNRLGLSRTAQIASEINEI